MDGRPDPGVCGTDAELALAILGACAAGLGNLPRPENKAFVFSQLHELNRQARSLGNLRRAAETGHEAARAELRMRALSLEFRTAIDPGF